jgi:hypothetical protein
MTLSPVVPGRHQAAPEMIDVAAKPAAFGRGS